MKNSFKRICVWVGLCVCLQLPASARVLYVSPDGTPDGIGASWETAFQTISAALTTSASGDQVWVRSATYSEAIELNENVSVYGGFAGNKATFEQRDWNANVTIIDATGLDRSAVIAADATTLDGFTIRGGNDYPGGGIRCDSCSPIITNCIITSNYVDGSAVFAENSSVQLSNCTISSKSGRGLLIQYSQPVLQNCLIEDNLKGGVRLDDSSSELIDCQIQNNEYFGIFCTATDSSSLHLANCVIQDNTNTYNKIGGGLYASSTDVSMVDCLIQRNYAAHRGGGCCIYSGTHTIESCQIINNKTKVNGGGCYLGGGTCQLISCQISNNQATGSGGGYYFYSAICQLTFCQISNNHAGGSGGGGISNGEIYQLTNCLISNNQAGGNGGGFYLSDGKCDLTSCQVLNNQAGNQGGGFYCNQTIDNWENCLVAGNQSHSGAGIYASRTNTTIQNCTIVDNSNSSSFDSSSIVGIYNRSSNIALTNTILWNGGREVSEYGGISATNCDIRQKLSGVDNIMALPLFVDASNGDYRLQDGSPCIDRGYIADTPTTDLDGNARPGGDGKVDIGAYESPDDFEPGPAYKPLYVRADAPVGGNGSSWEQALNKISTALLLAPSGTDIWVAAGHYPEAISMKPYIYLYGGFRGDETSWDERANLFEETIIDAAGLNQPVVVGSSWSELNGFALTGGLATNGGGLSCVSTSPLIQNCIIQDCLAMNGGGVALHRSAPTLVNCLIKNNKATDHGGGIWADYLSTPTIINCTIVGNQAISNSGGLYLRYSSNTIVYNTIFKNLGEEVITDSSNLIIQHSAIEGGYTGLNNTSEDPLFVDEAAGDYRLQAGSPCIDSGSNELVQGLYHIDLAGNYRIWDGDTNPGAIVDMGAYEFGSIPVKDYYGDLDSNGQMNQLDLFLFSTHWFEPNNETSFNYNPEPGEYVDEADLLNLMEYWK